MKIAKEIFLDRHNYSQQFIFIISLFLLLISTQNAFAKEMIIWSEAADYIAVEDVKNATNDHPQDLDANKIYSLLKNIRIQEEEAGFFDLSIFESEDEYSSEMFTRNELLKLSRHLGRAFATAKANQDVIFSVTDSHPKTIGKSSSTTTGRVFYKDGVLNLIIGEFRVDLAQKYRMRGGYSDVSEKVDRAKLDSFRLNVGNRNKSLKPSFSYLTDTNQSLYESDKGIRNDWLQINVDQALAAYAEPKKPESTPGAASVQADDKSYQTLEQKVETLERRLDEKQAASTPDPSTSSAVSNSVESRLSRLKNIYEKGLIDETRYNQKVQEILDDI